MVSKESATFGLPGKREMIVRLDADHGTLCRFGNSQVDQDNLERVKSNIGELYKCVIRGTIDQSKKLSQLLPKAASAITYWRICCGLKTPHFISFYLLFSFRLLIILLAFPSPLSLMHLSSFTPL